jgi:hypothetical protein
MHTKHTDVAVTLQPCIREIHGLNLCLTTGVTDPLS